MKKIAALVCALLACLCLLTGCAERTQPGVFGKDRFMWVDTTNDTFGRSLDIVVDKVTGVMYYSGYGGNLCPIYNSDGRLVIYDPIG